MHPLRPALSPSRAGLDGLLRGAMVPVWLPWPLPPGWLVTGFAGAGDERTGTQGCAVALSGPSPVGGPGEMMLVSECPGVGLGARFAGLAGPDPGRSSRPACPTPACGSATTSSRCGTWRRPAGRRSPGEVMGTWLWLVMWPDTAGVLLVEPLPVRDLRDPGQELDLPFGAPSPQLPG